MERRAHNVPGQRTVPLCGGGGLSRPPYRCANLPKGRAGFGAWYSIRVKVQGCRATSGLGNFVWASVAGQSLW
eukprot:9897878-Prorocentrum_lima.AAC.1